MIHKSLLAIFIGCTALVGSLMVLSLFRPGATAAPTDVSVDISVDTSSFAGFSSVYITDTRVLATGPVTIALQATGLNAYNAASLRVYTENDPGEPGRVHRGMVGQTVPTDTVPFKVWTPNFGPSIDHDDDGGPDVDNDLNWKSITQAVWAYVLDMNEPVSETVPPWDHPVFDYTDLFKWSDAHNNPDLWLPSGLNLQQPVHFALVLERKAHPQVYSTQLFFEFALSDDWGDSFTTYTTSMPLSSTLDDADPIVNLSVDADGFQSFPTLDP